MFNLQPFPPYQDKSSTLTQCLIPSGLPAPVDRFFEALFEDSLPVIQSTVITGRGTIRFMGITFPSRWRFIYIAGSGYRHYIESTVLGYPLLKVNEYYHDGHSRLELPFGVVENQPKVDLAANLGLWGESIWFPSIFLTDPRVQWTGIDDTTAYLTVPFGDTSDHFTVSFDPDTGLISRLEALRYRDAADTEKINWRNEVLEWKRFNGVLLPSRAFVRWMDQASPWFVLTVDEVVYNVDVDHYIRARGI